MQWEFNCLDGLNLHEKGIFIFTNHRNSIEGSDCNRSWKTEQKKNNGNKNKEGTSKKTPKKGCFVNKTNRTSQATSNTYSSTFNANTLR